MCKWWRWWWSRAIIMKVWCINDKDVQPITNDGDGTAVVLERLWTLWKLLFIPFEMLRGNPATYQILNSFQLSYYSRGAVKAKVHIHLPLSLSLFLFLKVQKHSSRFWSNHVGMISDTRYFIVMVSSGYAMLAEPAWMICITLESKINQNAMHMVQSGVN